MNRIEFYWKWCLTLCAEDEIDRRNWNKLLVLCFCINPREIGMYNDWAIRHVCGVCVQTEGGQTSCISQGWPAFHIFVLPKPFFGKFIFLMAFYLKLLLLDNLTIKFDHPSRHHNEHMELSYLVTCLHSSFCQTKVFLSTMLLSDRSLGHLCYINWTLWHLIVERPKCNLINNYLFNRHNWFLLAQKSISNLHIIISPTKKVAIIIIDNGVYKGLPAKFNVFTPNMSP
jgi:hypothetical protein